MAGNAAEEGLMTQIGNPSHTDPARIGVIGGILLGAFVWFSLRILLPELGVVVTALLSTALSIAVATRTIVVLTRGARARREAALLAARRAAELETERQMARAKRGGAFGRWEK